MVTKQVDIAEKIDDFIRRLRTSLSVERVILFGSYAKGTAQEDSDIDVAVFSPDFEGLSSWECQEWISKASVGRAYRISPIGFPSSAYRNPLKRSFLREILRTGKVVFSID